MKILKGKVVSSKMLKTIIVLTVKYLKHPFYKKYVFKSNKYHVHDKYNLCKNGDEVLIKHVKPISKKKFWELIKII